MKYEVFNKRPSKKAIKNARFFSNPVDQAEELVRATAPAKGEIWKSKTRRCLLIKSDPFLINDSNGESFTESYGVIAADIISQDLETDVDIFFQLSELLKYKKIGKKK